MSNSPIVNASLVQLINHCKNNELQKSTIFAAFLDKSQQLQKKLNLYTHLRQDIPDALPIAVKANFASKDKLPTTASSKVLDNYLSPYDSTVISKLNHANFATLGKTNMDAWAHGSSTETSDWGTSKNPHNDSFSPGGSSGGSAAAVASGAAPVAIGSETGGSIRQPASWCGVIGIKPTYGRVSRYGLLAMCSSTDCPGVFARNIADGATMLEIIAGHDLFDATSLNVPVPSYASMLKSNKKYSLAIPRSFLEGLEPAVKRDFDSLCALLAQNGHKITPIDLMDPKYAVSIYTIIQRAEVASNLARYDGIRFGKTRDAFASEAKKRMILGNFVLSSGYADQYYKKAQSVRTLLRTDFRRIFGEYDLILSPTTPSTALPIGSAAKHPFFGEMMDILTEPAAMVGIPSLSFPMGKDEKNLPTGAQIMAPWLSEETMLDFASQIETLTGDFFGITNSLLSQI